MNDKRAKVPGPPHPHRRNEALPSQSPKSPVEDPDAPARIATIVKSPGYGLAEQDIAFLGSDAMRGVRLLLEYLKPELLFKERAIVDTIVVFGSTRICEPGAARRNLEALREALAGKPGATPSSPAVSPSPSASSPRANITTWRAHSAAWSGRWAAVPEARVSRS